MLWQWRRLDEEKPPQVLRRELLIGLSIHRQRRSDVHETNLFDAFRKVETQSMRDASTAIVRAHKKLLVSKMTHRLHLVQSHCTERVIDVAISVVRPARISVPTQVRYVYRKSLGESGRHFVPRSVGLGISVQKKHGWPVAFVNNRDGSSAGPNFRLHKAGKKLCRDILRRLRRQFGQRYGSHGDRLAGQPVSDQAGACDCSACRQDSVLQECTPIFCLAPCLYPFFFILYPWSKSDECGLLGDGRRAQYSLFSQSRRVRGRPACNLSSRYPR